MHVCCAYISREHCTLKLHRGALCAASHRMFELCAARKHRINVWRVYVCSIVVCFPKFVSHVASQEVVCFKQMHAWVSVAQILMPSLTSANEAWITKAAAIYKICELVRTSTATTRCCENANKSSVRSFSVRRSAVGHRVRWSDSLGSEIAKLLRRMINVGLLSC